MARVFTAVTVVGAFVLVGSRLADLHAVGAWAKMIAATGFIATAFAVGAHTWNYGRILLAGLFFSWWGDFFLLGSTDTRFLLGLVSFLTAHVLYCIAFGVRGIHWRWAAATVPVVVLAAGGLLLWLNPYVSAEMAWPVRAYTAVISLMVVFAIGARGAGGPWSIPIGAVLFYLSDISVASGQFVKPDFPNYVWGLPFYFIGQIFLAWSGSPKTDT